MKLVNESNWKQEIARLKVACMLKCRIMDELKLDYAETNGFENNPDLFHIKGAELLRLAEDVEQLDKAIETIENVFVHKQCWIEI